MATILWECGFEAGNATYYTEKGWDFSGGTIVSTAAEQHRSISSNGGNYSLHNPWGGRTPVFGTGGKWVHFWMAPYSATIGTVWFQFYRAGNGSCNIYFSANGSVSVSNGTGTPGFWNPNVGHWIAIEAVLKDVGGQVTVKVDGRQVCQYTGDTVPTSILEDWDQIYFSGQQSYRSFDDMIVTTDDELPERYIPAIVPNGDSGSPGLTPSSGTNWGNAAQMPVAAKTPYNEALATTLEDNYTYTDIAWTPDNIDFVAPHGYATRDGSIIQGRLRCNGVDGAAQNLPAAGSWEPISEIWNGDPADSDNPWTKAKITALTAGFEFI